MQNSTNIRILELLRFLYERTDENHPAIITEILAYLKSQGIHADRKTVAADIRDLQEAGWDIISFGTFMGTDPSNAICTVKVQGCSQSDLVDLLKPMVREILDVREA